MELGIDARKLRALYRHERLLIPHTPASRRLDYDEGGVDPSAILPPEGKDADWRA